MKRTASLVLCLTAALGLPAAAVAQEAGEPGKPPGVEPLAWIAGTWAGSMGDDTVEETWLAPAGGAMIGVFRWLRGGEVYLYELISVRSTDGGVVLEIKHFGPDLVGWEERADAVTFDLVEAREGHAVFAERGDETERSRLVYRRDGEDGLTVSLEETRDGEPVELVFRYRRRQRAGAG